VSGQHTPGPWHVEADDGTFYVCHPGTVCVVTTICELNPDGSSNTEANANLIATAPDLLAELERVSATLAALGEFPAMQATVNAAIAKATGARP
jgi:hypothetical protein